MGETARKTRGRFRQFAIPVSAQVLPLVEHEARRLGISTSRLCSRWIEAAAAEIVADRDAIDRWEGEGGLCRAGRDAT